MISTQDLSLLPDRKSLLITFKAISVLDAILSQEWQYRYYSFNSKWDEHEQCLQMRNGHGDEMHALFRDDGCCINGFAHEYDQQDKSKLTDSLPSIFREFIFGEPVKSIGTTFCIWTTGNDAWQVGQIDSYDDNSQKMLAIFDGQAQTYVDWATDYFDEGYKESGIPVSTVERIYKGETLTKEMVLSIVDELEDWEQLQTELEEIGYPYDFK